MTLCPSTGYAAAVSTIIADLSQSKNRCLSLLACAADADFVVTSDVFAWGGLVVSRVSG